jgi:hypothetical protein
MLCGDFSFAHNTEIYSGQKNDPNSGKLGNLIRDQAVAMYLDYPE